MYFAESVRHELAGSWNVETTVLDHLLALVQIDVEPLILGLEEEAKSENILSLGEFYRGNWVVGCVIVVKLLLKIGADIGSEFVLISVLLDLFDAATQAIDCLLNCLGLSDIPHFLQ